VDLVSLRPIGVVRSGLRSRKDAPRQAHAGAPGARLELDPRYADALQRVSAGMDLLVLTWLHQADREVLLTHPMGDETIPLTGVFATRSPDRPNPVGLHRVTVVELEPPATLRVAALEAIDGTPILDLKAVMDHEGA
jgi:tRNA-Thr(GGU) m(6)t(6)A37 methyltransferase TsaA